LNKDIKHSGFKPILDLEPRYGALGLENEGRPRESPTGKKTLGNPWGTRRTGPVERRQFRVAVRQPS